MQSKQLLGQYYTTTDPFNNSDAFKSWYSLVPKDEPILEPFAGAGNLFDFIDDFALRFWDIKEQSFRTITPYFISSTFFLYILGMYSENV